MTKEMPGEKHNTKLASTFTLDNYSSTTKLASHEVKIPIGSKESINTKDEYYNPFDHRSVEHPNSTTGSLIHLLKSSLGTGILAMPNAFRNAGLLFGFIGTLLIGFLCTYCVHIFVKASYVLCRRAKVPSMGFAETSEAAFIYGPKPIQKFSTAAKIIVNFALVVTYLMGNCVYVVFIAESLEQLFEYWFPETDFNIKIYILMIMGPLILSTQVRELKHMVPYSFLANVFMIISLGITLYYMFSDIPDLGDREMFTSFGQFPMFFSTVLFAMEGIGVVMPVENSMKKPQHFLGCPGVLNTSMSIVVVLYAVIGFFGYLKYGDDTHASITLNLPLEELPAQIVKLLIALSVFFTYNLQMYVPIDIVWRNAIQPHINGKVQTNVAQVILRVAFVCLTIGIAAGVPKLEPIIGLVGSICFSTLGILVPSIVETAIRWEGDLGLFNWVLIKNIILAIFSIFALVSGTAQSISTLLEN